MMWLRVFLVVLAMAVPGCADPFGTGVAHIGIEVDKQVVARTDSVLVTVRVSNVSARKIEIGGYSCPRNFRVIDRLGRIVAPEAPYCTLEGRPPIELASGATKVYVHTWRPQRETMTSEALGRGTYKIRGYHSANGRLFESKSVEIRIE